MKIKINSYVAFIFFLLSIFAFGYTIRASLFPNLQYVSLLYIIGVLIFLYANRKNISKYRTLLLLLYLLATIVSDVVNNISFHQWSLYFFMNTLPLLVLIVDDRKVRISEKSIYKLVRLYNFFVFIIFGIYLIDLFTNSAIMRFVGDNIITVISQWVPHGASLFRTRYASYLGHSLYTDVVYLGFYVLNAQFTNSYGKSVTKPLIYNIIAGIGVLSTGSKTGLLVLAILLVVYNATQLKYMVSIICGVFVLYFLGFFNILTTRLQTEEFSTGRFDSWTILSRLPVMKTHIFWGLGDNMFSYLNHYADFGVIGYASEFPFLWILFRIGIVGICCMLLLMLILPLKNAIKYKSFRGSVALICIFVAISSFNGVIAYPDVQITYDTICFLVLFMLKNATVNYFVKNGKIQKNDLEKVNDI